MPPSGSSLPQRVHSVERCVWMRAGARFQALTPTDEGAPTRRRSSKSARGDGIAIFARSRRTHGRCARSPRRGKEESDIRRPGERRHLPPGCSRPAGYNLVRSRPPIPAPAGRRRLHPDRPHPAVGRGPGPRPGPPQLATGPTDYGSVSRAARGPNSAAPRGPRGEDTMGVLPGLLNRPSDSGMSPFRPLPVPASIHSQGNLPSSASPPSCNQPFGVPNDHDQFIELTGGLGE